MSKKSVEVHHDFLRDLQWHTMPKDQGQIVQVDYACSGGCEFGMFERIYDSSTQVTDYVFHPFRANASERGLRFEPWNGILPTAVCLPQKVKVIK